MILEAKFTEVNHSLPADLGVLANVFNLDDSSVRKDTTWSSQKISETINATEDRTVIVNEASGSIITLNDSSNRELQGLTISNIESRNLFNKQAGRFEFTQNGITYGAYIDTGNSVWKYATDTSYSFVVPCLPNTDYTLSGVSNAGIVRIATITEYDEPTVEHTVPVTLLHNGGNVSSATVTTNQEANYLVVQVSSAVVGTVQLEIGSVATEYTPYCGSITVKVMGKNLYNIDYSAINRKDINNGDPNVEHLENGVIVQGKNSNNTGSGVWANGWLNLQYHPRVYLTKGDVVRISYDFTILEKLDGVTPTKWVALLYGASQYEAVSRWDTFNVGEKVKMSAMHTIGVSGEYYPIITLNSCKAKIENIQIEYGSVSTDYEPYKEAQTLVVSIPNGLGADGFVCEDFAQLHTYKPNTTITNDVGAIMEVEYVADTKAYIDNKFTELQNAILASGANV